jgi:hypothetical protein
LPNCFPNCKSSNFAAFLSGRDLATSHTD